VNMSGYCQCTQICFSAEYKSHAENRIQREECRERGL
jgi:hypothetical protein